MTRFFIGYIRYVTIIVGAFIFGCFTLVVWAKTQPPSSDDPAFPRFVLRQIDDQYRGNSSHGFMEMRIQTRHWSRSLKMESWSMGRKYSLVKIIEPIKEKGSATLKTDTHLYTYLNKTGRTIKINASMMEGAWMGSHFTNDDLVQETELSEDFDATLHHSATWGKRPIYVFELIPKPGRPIVYGKIHVGVFVESLQPAYQLFFDEKGKKVKKMEYSDYRKTHNRFFPHKITMKPLDKFKEFTSIRWDKIQFDVQLNKAFFSVHRLKSI